LAGMEYAQHAYQGAIAVNSRTRRYLHDASQIDPRVPALYEHADLIVLRKQDFEEGFYIPFAKEQFSELVPPTQEFLNHLASPSRMRAYDAGTIQLYLSTSHTGTVQYTE
ncbi:MAG: hypothetical protein PVI80_15180, partial [Anaerolineae bacterium]